MKLTPSELTIHRFLTNHDITLMSAKMVAEQLFVSRSSIYRVCQKMGYSSFSHYKYSQKISQNNDGIIEVNSLDVFDHVDDHELMTFIQHIQTAQVIYVVGIFATEIAARYFVRQLLNLGYQAILISDSYEFESRALHITNQDILIDFSVSGYVSELHHSILTHCKAPILAITRTSSDLAKLAQSSILFDFEVSHDDSPFVRENLYEAITIAQKILINLNQGGTL